MTSEWLARKDRTRSIHSSARLIAAAEASKDQTDRNRQSDRETNPETPGLAERSAPVTMCTQRLQPGLMSPP